MVNNHFLEKYFLAMVTSKLEAPIKNTRCSGDKPQSWLKAFIGNFLRCSLFSSVTSNLRHANTEEQGPPLRAREGFWTGRKEQLAKNAVNHSDVRETLASSPLPSYVAKLGRLFGRRSLFLSLSAQWIPVASHITVAITLRKGEGPY